MFSETRKKAQKPPCKDLEPKGPKPQPFWFKATYTPVSNRAFLRSVVTLAIRVYTCPSYLEFPYQWFPWLD
ncbi:hypothetical protein GFB64_12060 [Lacticaseibacillus paracasei]|nr:hypothetical protein GFB64_12060 [Lacticaseibacillus paracasei]